MYGIDIFADDYFVLLKCTHLADRQTDGRTNRQTDRKATE